MPILSDYGWRKSDARKGEQGCCGPREQSPANPNTGPLDAVRGSTAKFRKELRH